ncbi:GntR family transcriptional regulator [Pseudonocardia acidicola]|uniref:GntR family transcriptional regulator n=1 Tax=Pseudonocardia acidicola TaxID=2724939 RepID=A0ABX1S7Z6_9PSEU|nr:GntR family transcriptional regulator [Pseudonocardia acidicola]NMH97685.1 GntR family transcriptional regulator [Pseudonocardia acidicola]
MTVDPGAAPAADRGRRVSAVSRVVDQIRHMMRTGELVPGQQVRQESLAVRLGVSRIPVREALKALETEGVLRHEPHVGYSVTRLNAEELRQAYLMRRALETEVLLALPRLTGAQLRELTAVNTELSAVVPSGEVARIAAANHRFHLTMFRFSGLHLVVDEIDRIWKMTDAYRTVHLYDQGARRRVVREHRKMITALRRGDNPAVVALMDAHRDQTVADLGPALGLHFAVPARAVPEPPAGP